MIAAGGTAAAAGPGAPEGTGGRGAAAIRPAPATAEPVLEIAGLDVTYAGGVRAAAATDLTVRRGEIVGVIGESGSATRYVPVPL